MEGAGSACTSWRRKRGGSGMAHSSKGGAWRSARRVQPVEADSGRLGARCRAMRKSRGGGVQAHGPLWAGQRGLGLENSALFYLFKKNSNQFELIHLNSGLPKFKKIQINYGSEGFEVRNNFPYRNFLRFKNNFGLKFKEVSRV
jgi:hypothetical protein